MKKPTEEMLLMPYIYQSEKESFQRGMFMKMLPFSHLKCASQVLKLHSCFYYFLCIQFMVIDIHVYFQVCRNFLFSEELPGLRWRKYRNGDLHYFNSCLYY